ncbi:MAG TPA: efflux RND transporter periplasmic adaptor subunit [Bryobacteraceae bacterium]|nr:efflux RND transporter periplasmic adaptor subunit [Bryobacteraceae bacterium]
METELKSLQIDRSKKRRDEPSPWAVRWILAGIALFVLLGAARFIYGMLNAATEVEVVRVRAASSLAGGEGNVILNATGYIVAAHKIELAAKVIGKVAWIGVDKGDKVKAGQVLVRLEDDEYRANVLSASGNLATLQARLAEAEHGSRPEEIAKAKADADQARADQENARVTLERTRTLVNDRVLSKQALDDAQARYDGAVAKVASFERAYELVRLGPRQEEIDALRAQVKQAQGTLNYAQVQLDNTVIRAPVDGTVLERNVEIGEFVTTGFVGDKGAKGYVVSLADLNDLEVELDINQNDFAKLGAKQPGVVTTDAYPDRKYQGFIKEVSPEANRQKATVQVKVKVLSPDQYLRPEMNASVAFYSPEKPGSRQTESKPIVTVPSSAIRDNSVFLVLNGRAVRRAVKVAGSTSQSVQVAEGLIGGEDIIANPPADLKDGQRVHPKKG